MVYSKNYKYPTDEELTVQEIDLSLPVLRATALFVGKACDDESKEFMLCRSETLDPRKCLAEGRAVTACGLRFMQKLKAACMKEVEAQASCLEYAGGAMIANRCRETEAPMEKCIFEATGIKKPHLGYFSMPRIHHTEREKPVNPLSTRVYQTPPGFESAPDEIKNMKVNI
ncbi:NADH dehydrogenase [ubiquinone] 1 alpha subcomplex subunit 8 [Galendromus occidentalis]|uniref:NADH dehydrogenase [ubiquinone] 1 alpha subcomplex subunit 8 n=1 Tax=Galendromus occidentalis TaxID=34638 RepID=A0AAJ6VVB5_9ACAR|nr:NADH dehydrogenase [ubiquinone] 1 alpha subcomplex subunit 8 [Galendromus occidentalis]